MKSLLAAAAVAALTILITTSASAFTQYPNAGCPDSLSIIRLKTLLNQALPCAPVTNGTTGSPGDTVNGVGGIIIGFDEIPTGFDIYVEQSAGGQNSGIDVFTHGTNFRPIYGFNRGDSIVVEYARVSNFFGDVELEAPNNVFSNPNIVLRTVSTGNPLPPIFTGNTTDFVETPTNMFIAPYMSSLVKLTGPVRVARTLGLATHGMLVVRDDTPGDSTFIDYNKLTHIVPPAVGTYLTSVTGIVNSASRGWRIMPRDANDVVDVQPPNVTDAYAVADNQYRIVFDRDVTPATATNTANYGLASFGTVNSSVMDGTAAAILTVSGTGLSHGQSETVTVSGITGLANGVTMSTPATGTFLAGVLSCGEMAAPDPDSLAAMPCRDRSRYQGSSGQYINGGFGPRSTLTGIVVGQYGNLYYMEDSNPSNNRGITIFAPPQALTLGHQYVVAGACQEYYSEIEFAGITYIKDTGTPGVPSAVPLTVAIASLDTCDAAQNITSGRDYLSDLVSLTNVKVVQRYPTPTTTGFHVVGPTYTYGDTIYIENQNNVLGPYDASNPNYPPVGTLVSVVGCMHYTTNTSTPSFRVCPRTASDITIVGAAGVGQTSLPLSFAVFPNPSNNFRVTFTLPTTTNVELGVYDVVGRRVAVLAQGEMPAGRHERAWSGQEEGGARARPGMYFYRLRAGNEVLARRAVLLKN